MMLLFGPTARFIELKCLKSLPVLVIRANPILLTKNTFYSFYKNRLVGEPRRQKVQCYAEIEASLGITNIFGLKLH